ncbi:hypothetical protein L1049_003354 [Liquidambar formosana]|uniref:HTH myb-type domain-containing protein n=1 Tax=Liquidambar formosana TaxID=63359 RepID=A0AAP0NMJ6_LIQFO
MAPTSSLELTLCTGITHLKEEARRMKQSMESDQPQRPLIDFFSLKRNSDDEQTALLERDFRKGKNLLVDSSPHLWSTPNSDKKQKTAIIEPCKLSIGEGAFMPFKGGSSNPAATTSKAAATKRGGNVEVTERPRLQPYLPPTVETLRTDPGHRRSILMGNKTNMMVPMMNNNHGPDFQPLQLQAPIWKNSRRCWSPELHDRFMKALEKLGGSEAATPKQIRELMRVDGLTNDQVKSHLQVDFESLFLGNGDLERESMGLIGSLEHGVLTHDLKYRLHNRRSPATDASPDVNPANPPANFPGFLAPGDQYKGNWMPSATLPKSPQDPRHIAGAAGGTLTTSDGQQAN